MPPKLRHECERCGLVAEIERAARFGDRDFHDLLQDYFSLEVQLGHANARLADARERIDQLRELVTSLPDPAIEIEPEPEECPFGC